MAGEERLELGHMGGGGQRMRGGRREWNIQFLSHSKREEKVEGGVPVSVSLLLLSFFFKSSLKLSLPHIHKP